MPWKTNAELSAEIDALRTRLAELEQGEAGARLAAEAAGRRAAMAWSVLEVSRTIPASLDLAEVGQRIADSLRALVGAEASTLYRLDDASGNLLVLASSGNMGPALGRTLVLPRGTGVSGLAVQERRPVVSANALTDPRITLTPEIREQAEGAPFRAVLAFPLLVQDRVIGAVAVADRAGRAFEDEEIRLVQAFADQAALALDNARLYEAAQRRLTELATVQQVARAINSTLRLEEVFQTVVTQISGAFGYRMVYISLLTHDGLELQASVGYEHVIPLIPWGRGLTARVARTGRGEFVREAAADKDFVFAVPDVRQAIVVPLKAGDGQVLGTLGVESTGDPVLTEGDLALLTLLADQVSVAVANARLYAETIRRQREAEELARTVEESQQRVIQGERLRALGELAGGVAHDFNNVLAVVLGRAQILLRQTDDADTHRQAEVIEQVTLEGARTVRRIQEFARMRRSRPFQPVDLRQVIADVVEVTRSRWRDQAQSQGVTYDLHVEAGSVPPISGDPAELREALTNLVLNALDAMPDGGRLTLETGVEGENVRCVVADTGVGMSEEVRPRIFDPFFTTKGEQGTGLGLSLVYGTVRRHGGDIRVRTRLALGSTFTLRFPASREVEPVPEALGARPSPSARILVIDDEETIREMLRDVLSGQGHTVVTCADGPSGLARLQEGPFELVFTDLGMPHVSGWEVARRVKQDRPGTPVALVTGWGDQIDPGEARARGIDFLLSKPCQIDDVRAIVAQVLARKASSSS